MAFRNENCRNMEVGELVECNLSTSPELHEFAERIVELTRTRRVRSSPSRQQRTPDNSVLVRRSPMNVFFSSNSSYSATTNEVTHYETFPFACSMLYTFSREKNSLLCPLHTTKIPRVSQHVTGASMEQSPSRKSATFDRFY